MICGGESATGINSNGWLDGHNNWQEYAIVDANNNFVFDPELYSHFSLEWWKTFRPHVLQYYGITNQFPEVLRDKLTVEEKNNILILLNTN